eukprot:3099803-Rhodomonas_salina.3
MVSGGTDVRYGGARDVVFNGFDAGYGGIRDVVLGGSWGVTLAIAYAQEHPGTECSLATLPTHSQPYQIHQRDPIL